MAAGLQEKTLICKFGEGSEDIMSVFVSRDGTVLTGHESKLKVWVCQCYPLTWSISSVVDTPVQGDVNSICEVVDNDRCLFVISVDNNILFYNQANLAVPFRQVCFNKEEINQLDANSKGSLLCACDDSGEIKVIDVRSFQVIKTLCGHDNICATVTFIARKPWELVSGGLDCKLVRWDFNRGRPLAILDQVELVVDCDDETPSVSGYSINPPMVHCISTLPSTSTVVCGLGNGNVAVYGLRSSRGMDRLCVASFHSTSIACICSIEISRPGSKSVEQYIVSGGNDKMLCVIKLCTENDGKAKAKRKHLLKLVSQWNNGSKINWMFAQSRSVKDGTQRDILRVFVADQTSLISVYECILNHD